MHVKMFGQWTEGNLRLLTRLALLIAVLGAAVGVAQPRAQAQAGLDGLLQQGGGQSGGDGENEPVVQLKTVWSATAGEAGEQVVLSIVMNVDEGYSVTSHEEERPQIPLSVEVTDASSQLGLSSPLFPEPHTKDVSGDELSVLSGESVIYLPVQVREGEAGETLRVAVDVTWQACDDTTCLIPETTSLTAELPIVAKGEAEEANAELFADYFAGVGSPALLNIPFFGWDFQIDPRQVWLVLVLAAVGGFLLNLTPCVLPLIPIKIMGLNQAAGTRGRTLALGLVMVGGVVAFWLGLGVVISTVSGFTATNQLFQYPWFTVGVGVVIAAMAVGMCGLFTVQLPQWVYRMNPSQDSVHGSFGFGVMIAVLSTPCTAPFMGAAAAWAALQSPALTLSTFAAIGLGMAAPYLVLAAFPQLTHRMPKAGPASELIKQVMGVLMLAAAAYFLGTGLSGLLATPPDPPTQVYWWVVGALIAAAGVWLAWRTLRIAKRPIPRNVFAGLGVLFVVVGVGVGASFSKDSPVNWIYYTPERLEEAQARGDVVVLEFTAAWCLNCKALEQAVLHDDDVVQGLNAEGVSPIKIDITGNNAPGNAKLAELGRQMIPFLVVYDREGEVVLSSDAYTVGQVVEALEQARGDEEATVTRAQP